MKRRMPIGADVSDDGVHFRVWAPKRQRVEVVSEVGSFDLTREAVAPDHVGRDP